VRLRPWSAPESGSTGDNFGENEGDEPQFLARLISRDTGRGSRAAHRTRAILASQNDSTTDSFQQIMARSPRPLAEFLREHRAEFV